MSVHLRLFVAFAVGSLAGPAAAADFQHALIIIADDLGTDKVGSYAADVDNPTETRPSTPTMDLLAGVGVRFTDAWATPMCSPTRAMLYSGEWPSRNGVGAVLDEGSPERLEATPDTLAQLAQDNGVATGLFGKWHLGEDATTPDDVTTADLDIADRPVQVGFEWFQGNTDGQLSSYTSWLYMESIQSATMSSGYLTRASTKTDRSPTAQASVDALAWLDDRSAAGERRITFMSYHLPHSTGAGSEATWNNAVVSCGGTARGSQVVNQRQVVNCFDDELADLLASVPELDETLVVFLGDNGTPKAVAEGNFSDGRGKSTVYESGIRVPFMLADGAALQDALDNGGVLPDGGTYRVEAGLESGEPASLVDVYATVADLLDLSSPTCAVGDTCARDSISLRPVLEGGLSDRAVVWTELYSELDNGSITGKGAVRLGDYKLVVYVSNGAAPCRSYELYDLVADRFEQDDLVDDPAYATEQAALVAALDQLMADTAGGADWIAHAACDACAEVETWYDGFDSNCDAHSDFDQDADGVEWSEDCVDTDATAYPGAAEVWYDGVDGDCAGGNDFDQDGDTFDLADDCDDTRADVWPGATETAYDGVDADCLWDSDSDADGDGLDSAAWGGTDCDDADASVWPGAPEVSGDGVDSDCDGTVEVADHDADGAETSVDCDDDDATTYPGAYEVPYDGIDQDCDGEDLTDADGDGYPALVTGGTDCDDGLATAYPGATDAWYDGVDANCDGGDDYDQDGDGYAVTPFGADCGDTSARIKPTAREVWYDGVDQNCDGGSDYDRDGDGYLSSAYGGTDCEDTRSAVNPGASEIWYDGVDQNCDGADDFDRDGDGWPQSTDCNDGAARVYPGAPGWSLACVRVGR